MFTFVCQKHAPTKSQWEVMLSWNEIRKTLKFNNASHNQTPIYVDFLITDYLGRWNIVTIATLTFPLCKIQNRVLRFFLFRGTFFWNISFFLKKKEMHGETQAYLWSNLWGVREKTAAWMSHTFQTKLTIFALNIPFWQVQ